MVCPADRKAPPPRPRVHYDFSKKLEAMWLALSVVATAAIVPVVPVVLHPLINYDPSLPIEEVAAVTFAASVRAMGGGLAALWASKRAAAALKKGG